MTGLRTATLKGSRDMLPRIATLKGSRYVVMVALAALMPAAAAAQPAGDGSLELAGGIRWTGKMSAGGSSATETAPGGNRFTLFEADTALESGAGLGVDAAVRISPSIDVGASMSFTSYNLRTRITSDVEGVPDAEAAEPISELALEGRAVVRFARWRTGPRAVPFVAAGGGFLRHLHEGRTLVENGSIYYVAAGMDYALTSGGAGLVKRSGLRAEFRTVMRAGGIAFDDALHLSPALGVSLFARF
jgi:opacity protein-like surface antigen